MDKKIDFSLDFQEFAEKEELGEFDGILVNYNATNLAHGYYKFAKGSMKINEGKTMLLLWNHMGSKIPVGTIKGTDGASGFNITAKLQLTKDEGGYVNKEAYSLYDLMKNQGAKLELSAGGVITKGESKTIKNGDKSENYFEIQEFVAHEGSLTPRGAVGGSKVTKVFSGGTQEETMNPEEFKAMLAEFTKSMKDNKENESIKLEFSELKTKYKELEEKFGAKDEEIKELKGTLEKFDAVINELSAPTNTNKKVEFTDNEMFEVFGQAIVEMNKKGPKEVTLGEIMESETFATGSTTTIAAAVKSQFMSRILQRIQDTNPIMRDVTFLGITDNSLTIPREMIGLPETAWIGESDERVETDGVALDDVKIELYQLYAMPILTNKLLGTNFVQLGSFLMMRVTDALDKAISDALLLGDGTGKPTGILINTDVAASLVAWTDESNSDPLIDLVTGLKEGYSMNSKYYMHRLTWGHILKLKDGQGNYIVGSLADRAAKTIQNRPVVLVDSMKPLSSATTDEPVILFGDVNKGMMGIKNDKLTLQIEDKVTKKGFTKFYSEMGLGAEVVLPEAFGGLKKS